MISREKEARIDPRVTRTRKLIEDAFLEVMEEKGFGGLSVQDVADRAGINRVTFYSHFVDIHALLRHSIRKAFEAEIESKGLAQRTLTPVSVRDLFVTVCMHVAGLYARCKPPHEHLDWILGEVITDSCAQLFLRWSARPGKSAPRSFVAPATAAGSSLHALAARWSRSKRRGTATAYVDSNLSIVTGILRLT